MEVDSTVTYAQERLMLPDTCLRAILRPIVRVFVRHSHSIHEFMAMAKALYVEAANDQLEQIGERSSMSRISAMTGLNRRDISSIQNTGGAPYYQGATILARVLSNWENLAQFRKKSGGPKTLTADGEDSEFFNLVRSVSRDIHPSGVLVELRRSKLIEEKDGEITRVAEEAYVEHDLERGFSIIARDLNSFMDISHENVVEPKSVRNLHLRTEFDNIDPAKVPLLKKWLLEEGKAFHKKARAVFSKYDVDMGSANTNSKGGAKVVLTSFGQASVPK